MVAVMSDANTGLICIICRYQTHVDDARHITPSGRCICERCWHREVGDEKTVPRALRAMIEQALREAPEP